MRLVLQVGAELRIRNDGGIIMDNPEIELDTEPNAADAVFLYRFDAQKGEHITPLARSCRRSSSHQGAPPRRLARALTRGPVRPFPQPRTASDSEATPAP
jgi:hypothetical protein